MARNVYRVLPASGTWELRGPHGTLSQHITKQPAIEAGQKAAKADQPSQLVVHLANGQIEFEWTYGNDPYPPSG